MKPLMRQGAVGALLLAAILVFAPIHSWAQESGVNARKVVLKATPIYPTLARSMNIRGMVKVEATVAPNGTVKNVEVKGGHPILVQSALNAVRQWKFEVSSRETKELIEIKFDPE